MQIDQQTLLLLREQMGNIIMGTAFVLFGLGAATIAVIRRRSGVRILIWLAIWSGMYGVRLLIRFLAITGTPGPLMDYILQFAYVSLNYLIVVFALLAWLELAKGLLKVFLKIMLFTELAIAFAGIGWFVAAGEPNTFTFYNSLIAIWSLLSLILVTLSQKLSSRFLVLPDRGILATGTFIFAAEALYANVAPVLHYQAIPLLDSLGFAVLLFSLAFVAAQMIFANERRLVAIESELDTARRIQFSILPTTIPEIDGLRIAASYYPMSAVAGDFYDIIPVNQHQAGFLVADVSGHGVPAALIASMIKVAMQSAVSSAHKPGEVLHRLREILGNQLRGQFVTAAYLYVDSKSGKALYSAAGHPPLLHWDAAAGQINFIESNGLLFNSVKKSSYPTRETDFGGGDRFILYTDGLTEAMNTAGELFGDRRLGEVIQSRQKEPAGELSTTLFMELKLWQKENAQQDDLTWVIIDIL